MNARFVNVSRKLGEGFSVNNVSLELPHGQLTTFLGPSGCGKTTLLRMLAGLERVDSGEIFVGTTLLSSEKIFVPPHQRNMGMVFQSYALWPDRTVERNIAFPLEIRGASFAQIVAKTNEVLELTQLSGLGKRFPHELSGGQQQRVALARALAQAPQILLLDEPLSNLDAQLRVQMRKELSAIQKNLGITMVYVTHDRTEALELSHQIAVFDRGKLVQSGTPDEILASPANEFVKTFLTQ